MTIQPMLSPSPCTPGEGWGGGGLYFQMANIAPITNAESMKLHDPKSRLTFD